MLFAGAGGWFPQRLIVQLCPCSRIVNALGKGWVQGKHRIIFLISNDMIAMCYSKDRGISCFKGCSCFQRGQERAGAAGNGGHAGFLVSCFKASSTKEARLEPLVITLCKCLILLQSMANSQHFQQGQGFTLFPLKQACLFLRK